MDSEIKSGCEPAPAPGGGQGSTGGPVQEGNLQVHDGKATPVFKLQDIVYLRFKGDLLRVVIVGFHEFNNAIVVANGIGEYTVTRGDLISEAEHLANVFEENKKESAREHSRVLDAYSVLPPEITKISKINKWIAEQCSMTPREVSGAVRSLAHWKLIELPKQEDAEEKPE
jgi:hypothetical protein